MASLPERRVAAPLPFELQLVLCFAALHAARSMWLAGGFLARHATGSSATIVLESILPQALYVSFDVLLAAQIFGRARTAIFWGVTYFATLTIFGAAVLVVEAELWPALDVFERTRALASIGATLGLAAALLTRRSRRTLVR